MTRIDLSEETTSSIGGAHYDQICEAIRQDYVFFVGNLVNRSVPSYRLFSLDWWLSGTASRNFELSVLFKRIAQAIYFRDKLSMLTGDLCVVVESKGLRQIIEAIAHQHGRHVTVIHRDSYWTRFIRTIRNVLSPLRSAFRILFDWIVVRLFLTKTALSGHSVTLLDTFILPGAIDRDRYYPGLFNMLPRELSGCVYLVPQFHNFSLKAMIHATRIAGRGSLPYLFKEQYINILDVLWAVGHGIRKRRIVLCDTQFMGMDMKPLIEEDLRNSRSYRCAVQGLLNYRFATRLKDHSIRVGRAIDWYENHPLDRGWNAGFREFHPDADLVGYQGFYPSFPASRPSREERSAGIVPDVVAVMGPSMSEDVTEFDRELKTVSAPAFRYPHLNHVVSCNQDSDSKSKVLVVLPYDRSTSEFIVDLIRQVSRENTEYLFMIKVHPAVLENTITGFDSLDPHRSQFVSRPLDTLFNEAMVVIGGPIATSALESMASGLPYISIAPPGHAYQHKAPKALPDGAYWQCPDLSALITALSAIAAGNSFQPYKEQWVDLVRQGYFSPVNSAEVLKFIGFGDTPTDNNEISNHTISIT
ncbi:MAG: hypothetical protein DHS20C01_13940 [marine bacterium B5-7]|nr:MAG: hypothetical protein DHS20C01_13940 [marine bacterium B5-7]